MIEQTPISSSRLPEGYWYHPEGYAWFVLPTAPFVDLPEDVEVQGTMLRKKTEFHVTIMNVREVAQAITEQKGGKKDEVERDILSMLATYLHNHRVHLVSFRDDLRFAKKQERISIAGRCDMEGIEGFFADVESKYDVSIARQPAHVSLYTLLDTGAVGIDTDAEMENYTRVNMPVVQRLLGTI
ncbi:MAG: hypothetical protein WAZ27_02745 [Minisyncoccia bacterium]